MVNDTLLHPDITDWHVTLPCEIIWGWDNTEPCGEPGEYVVEFINGRDEHGKKIACNMCLCRMMMAGRILGVEKIDRQH